MTYYSFPEKHWISLRTTNPIEKVNVEFKRTTQPMEILTGEKFAYKLICFIAFKMEITWRKAPIGKKIKLPNLNKFTQNS